MAPLEITEETLPDPKNPAASIDLSKQMLDAGDLDGAEQVILWALDIALFNNPQPAVVEGSQSGAIGDH